MIEVQIYSLSDLQRPPDDGHRAETSVHQIVLAMSSACAQPGELTAAGLQ